MGAIVGGMSSYYFKKYSFNYPFFENDGSFALMCTIPVGALVRMYKARIGRAPESFFDCGAAIGYLVAMADKMGLRARGIDVRRYTGGQERLYNINPLYRHCGEMFRRGYIKIESILDAAPVTADLAYCNGTLTYMNEVTLPLVLDKFRNTKMLVAIHNTSEDVAAAKAMGDPIVHHGPRLIRSKDWWMSKFRANGFAVDWDDDNGCFCVRPYGHANVRVRDLGVNLRTR